MVAVQTQHCRLPHLDFIRKSSMQRVYQIERPIWVGAVSNDEDYHPTFRRISYLRDGGEQLLIEDSEFLPALLKSKVGQLDPDSLVSRVLGQPILKQVDGPSCSTRFTQDSDLQFQEVTGGPLLHAKTFARPEDSEPIPRLICAPNVVHDVRSGAIVPEEGLPHSQCVFV